MKDIFLNFFGPCLFHKIIYDNLLLEFPITLSSGYRYRVLHVLFLIQSQISKLSSTSITLVTHSALNNEDNWKGHRMTDCENAKLAIKLN
jgi:hypothetical protein